MAAFRKNARLVVRRLTWVQDARAPALVVNSARDRARMGRRYENAMREWAVRPGLGMAVASVLCVLIGWPATRLAPVRYTQVFVVGAHTMAGDGLASDRIGV